jgi:hypothetical protein
VATFVAMSVGYWLPGLGLPRLDFAQMNGNLLVPEQSTASFAWTVGLVDIFLLGMLAAVVYGRYLRSRLPGTGPVRGLIWGLVLCTVTGLTAFPLLFGGGVFGVRWDPGAPIALVLWHVAWGVTLGIVDESN